MKSYFVAQEDGKTLSSNDYTDEDKAKLDTIDDYLPLSGGTMDKGATVTLPYASDDRTLTLAPAGLRYQIPSSSGAAQGFTWYENDGSGDIACQMGLYNSVTTDNRYLYFGGTYSDPLMKLSTGGELTCSTSSADTFYEGGTTLSAKYKQWQYGTVGATSSVAQPYYKMASLEITGSSTPVKLSLKVTDGYNANAYGILTARVRTGSSATGAPSYATLYWEYLAGRNAVLSDYILAYKITDSGLLVEVWYHASSTYNTIHFCELLEASDYTTQSQSTWTLYSGTGLGETEIDSDYTQVTSSLPALRNPVTDLDDSGWTSVTVTSAQSSSDAVQYRTIGSQIFISGDITLSSALSSGTYCDVNTDLIGSNGLTLTGTGYVSNSTSGVACIVKMDSTTYSKFSFMFPNGGIAGNIIHFTLSGTID
ncbi:MAG: hypothetical protein LUF89_03735 [Ruminococcus sp.]|nr:hypothetical protein [Ruminococcus sp.]